MSLNSFTMLIILFRSNLCVCLLHVAQFKTFDSLGNCRFSPGRHGSWAVGLLLAKPCYRQLNILGYFNFLTTRGMLLTSSFVSGCFSTQQGDGQFAYPLIQISATRCSLQCPLALIHTHWVAQNHVDYQKS